MKPFSSEDIHNRLPKTFVAAVILVCLLPTLLSFLGFNFSTRGEALDFQTLAVMSPGAAIEAAMHSQAGSYVHTILEWSAFWVAAFTIVLAFLHYSRTGEATTLIIGLALFFAGVMDVLHVLAADHLIAKILDTADFVALTGAIRRFITALIIVLGAQIFLMRRAFRAKANLRVLLLAGLFLVGLAYGIIWLCGSIKQLPQTIFPTAVITRPYDLAALVVFLIGGLLVMPRFYRKAPSYLSQALVISFIPQIVTQLHMVFGSSALYDNHYNISHFVKVVAYLVPFAGLGLDYLKNYRQLDNEIGERQRAEETLRKEKAISESLIDSLPGIFYLFDEQHQWLRWNQTFERVTGYSHSEVPRHSPLDFFRSEDKNSVAKAMQAVFLTGENTVEAELLAKDGKKIPYFLTGRRIELEGKYCLIGMGVDISERRWAEQSLANSLSLLQATLESTGDGLLAVDAAGKVVSVNQKFAEMWGVPVPLLENLYSQQRLKTFGDLLSDPEAFLEKVETLLRQPEAESFDVLYLKDGRIIERYSQPQRLGEQIIGRVWSFREVTARYRAEEALRNEEERLLASIFSGTQDGLYIVDNQFTIARVNPTMEQWYSHSMPLVGRKCYAALAQRTEVCESCPWRRTLETGIGSNAEIPRLGPAGQNGWLDVYSFPLLDQATGQVKGAIQFLRDITEHKQAEEARDQLIEILEATPDLVSIADLNGRVRFLNRAGRRMLGFGPEEDISSLSIESAHPPGVREMLRNEALPTARRQGVWVGETVFLSRDGQEIPASQVILAHKTQAGEEKFISTVARDITERKQAEAAVLEAKDRLKAIIQASPLAVISTDTEGRLTSWNAAAERIFGWREDEVLGSNPPLVPEDWQGRYPEIHGRQLRGDLDVNGMEVPVCQKDGAIRTALLFSAPQHSATGEVVGAVTILEDITARKRTEEALRQSEEQLRQAQKMEAVGRLAGGVAHDFNNLLTAITGYTEMLMPKLTSQPELAQDVEEINKAAERAAILTRQLLAFSRKQICQPKVLDLNEVIANLDKMLRRLLYENIELTTIPSQGLGCVLADPGQIEQVIINLVANARDAMPRGGKLLIETADIELDEDYARQHLEVQPGPYVLLAVSDNGMGLDEGAKAHLFEPFFTTKEQGKGTGLGLSTVHGIVKQSGGHISVYSEPGRGTTFKIYLPRVDAREAVAELPRTRTLRTSNRETILLVEDEEVVRRVVRRILELNGYSVLEADRGEAAMSVSSEFPGPIHLLLTDVVMPGMSGKEVADQLTVQRPGIKVLFMSGHTENAIVSHGVLNPGIAFIQKPFRQEALIDKVQELLDA